MRDGLAAAVLAAGVLAAGTATGCAGSAPATSEPVIPPVTTPLDVTAFADRPCELLTPTQAARFGVDLPPRRIEGPVGNRACEWRGGTEVWIYISVFTDSNTLERVHENRGTFPYFQLTEIRGYPAIASRTEATLPACDIDIKTAEGQGLTVSYDSTEFNEELELGCVEGKKVAAAVLENVPPKG